MRGEHANTVSFSDTKEINFSTNLQMKLYLLLQREEPTPVYLQALLMWYSTSTWSFIYISKFNLHSASTSWLSQKHILARILTLLLIRIIASLHSNQILITKLNQWSRRQYSCASAGADLVTLHNIGPCLMGSLLPSQQSWHHSYPRST